jgi:hypothetical protein
LLVVAYFGWNPATELLFIGDGDYEVYGYWHGPLLTEHYLTFPTEQISETAQFEYVFRGFSPYEMAFASIVLNDITKEELGDSDLRFRITVNAAGEGVLLLDEIATLDDAVNMRYQERKVLIYVNGTMKGINGFRKYNVRFEVMQGDPTLSDLDGQLSFVSGWK